MATTTNTNRILVLALVALGLLVLLPAVFMGGGMMGYRGMMGPMYGTNAPGWMFAVGLVGQLLMVALVVGLGYLAYRTVTGPQADTAMEELRVAFARGDIDEDEFERRRETLERR